MRLPGLIAAAAEVLAEIETRHRPASEALKDWGLSHRFAGSGDRAAIGNLVYDALRRRASSAWRMGGETPWHLAVGAAVLSWGNDPRALNEAFRADPHAPEPIPEETIRRVETTKLGDAPDHVRADLPEWLAPHFEATFGADWIEEGAALAERPPLDLRVNTLKTSREKVARQLHRLGVEPTPFSPVGLRIPPADGPRRHPNVQAEEAFRRGRIEVQDEASQLCALMVGAKPGEQVLDICAGAGGKTLAIAAKMENRGQVYAYDFDKNRLAPIFERLQRAGARNVQVLSPAPDALAGLAGRMDRVLVDAPCAGTGVWRRRPDAKWRLTPEALARRIAEQDAALAAAAPAVKPDGILVYATCSLLKPENEERVAAFLLGHPGFARVPSDEAWEAALPGVAPPAAALAENALLLTPRRSTTDGFFVALLRRSA
ncbi:MAG: RsmB/NOP family class I SAM-dependent RNA methyltransferase [Propylenella sp.]